MAKLTDQQRSDILQAFVNGERVDVLANRYAVSETLVRKLAKDRGVTREPQHAYRRSDEEKAAIVQEYLDGEKVAIICRRYRISDETLRRMVRAAGHQVRSVAGGGKNPCSLAIAEALEVGEPIESICERLSVTKHAVTMVAKRRAIQVREAPPIVPDLDDERYHYVTIGEMRVTLPGLSILRAEA